MKLTKRERDGRSKLTYLYGQTAIMIVLTVVFLVSRLWWMVLLGLTGAGCFVLAVRHERRKLARLQAGIEDEFGALG